MGREHHGPDDAMALSSVMDATVAPESIDLALVVRARKGDAQAFERLLEARFWRLGRLALSITGNQADADDAIQIGCLRAWRDLPRLREPNRFDGWLWRIVVNSCRNVVRDRRRLTVHEITAAHDTLLERSVPSGPGPGESLPDNDAIQRAFARLDHDKRAILVLHHVDERPISEIAAILGIPEGTAKWRLHAARQALERTFEAEDR
jgi:RNA polymerase sigma-70 factor, ECF subfamily